MEFLRELPGHSSAINAVRFTLDGNYCMSCSDDRTIKLWNPHRDDPSKSTSSPTALLIKTYSGVHGYSVTDVTISRDNTKFASCGGDKICFLWDVTSSRIIKRFQGHTQRINTIDMNDEGSVLISGSYDNTVLIWDMRSNSREPIQTLSDFKDSVTSVAHTRGGKIIAGSIDGYIRTYDLRAGLLQTDRLNDPITCVRLSYDEKCVLATCMGSSNNSSDASSGPVGKGALRLLELSTGRLLQEFNGHVHEAYKLEACISNDGNLVFAGSEDGKVYAWDLVSGLMQHYEHYEQRVHSRAISSISFNPNPNNEGFANMFITSSYDGMAKVWKRKTKG